MSEEESKSGERVDEENAVVKPREAEADLTPEILAILEGWDGYDMFRSRSHRKNTK